MKNLCKYIGYLIILFAPLDSFKIFNSYFSIYRILIIILFPLVLINAIISNSLKINFRIFIAIFFLFISDIVCIITSKNVEMGKSFFLNDIFGIILIIEFLLIYTYDDREKLLLWYVKSQCISLCFALYIIYLHYFLHKVVSSDISLLFLRLTLDKTQLTLLSRTRSYLPQIFLPYATTLHFDLSVGIAAIICTYYALFKNKYKYLYIVLSLLFSLLVFLSAQRGPILSFVIILFIIFWFCYKKFGSKIIIKASFFLIILFCLVGNSVVSLIFRRFSSIGIFSSTPDRHFLLVFEAFDTWLESIKSFLIGCGYSSKSMMEGKYTFVPETFLCTYATLIAERGLFGIFTIYFYFVFVTYYKKRSYIIYNIIIYILLCFLFYELRYVQTVWICYAIFSTAYTSINYGKNII